MCQSRIKLHSHESCRPLHWPTSPLPLHEPLSAQVSSLLSFGQGIHQMQIHKSAVHVKLSSGMAFMWAEIGITTLQWKGIVGS